MLAKPSIGWSGGPAPGQFMSDECRRPAGLLSGGTGEVCTLQSAPGVPPARGGTWAPATASAIRLACTLEGMPLACVGQ
jgi:hypothetical protein